MDAFFGKANESLNCNLFATAQLLGLSRVVFPLLKPQLLICVQAIILGLFFGSLKYIVQTIENLLITFTDHLTLVSGAMLFIYSSAQIQSQKYMA